MIRARISYAVRAMAIGCIWCLLMWLGFLALDNQDDIALGLYVIAGTTGLSAFAGWVLFG